MLFVELVTPAWLSRQRTDLAHPDVAPWVEERAAWLALLPDGQPIKYAGSEGFRAFEPIQYATRGEAAQHGEAVCVDRFAGLPVRVWREPLAVVDRGRLVELASVAPVEVAAGDVPTMQRTAPGAHERNPESVRTHLKGAA